MNTLLKKTLPLLLILLGFLILCFIEKPIISGIFILLGIIMMIERKWPERMNSKNQNM